MQDQIYDDNFDWSWLYVNMKWVLKGVRGQCPVVCDFRFILQIFCYSVSVFLLVIQVKDKT